jgi:MYXO-CTERM domain-containing protein
MNRKHAIVAAALLASAGAASAFVRETTVQGDPGAGKCLYWGTRAVTYTVNATSAAAPPLRPACPTCAPCQDASAAVALVVNTLPTWGLATRAGEAQACTDFGLMSGGTTTATAMGNDGVNLIVFRTGWCGSTSVVPQNDPCRNSVGACAGKYNCWEHDASGTIGLTTITFDTGTGQILDTDIEFHGWDGNVPANGYYLTCAASPSCSQSPWGPPPAASCTSVDVASLALHEAGHVVGLDHTCVYPAPFNSCTPDSVMQPNIPKGSVRRALDADDVNGICTIYPRGAATVTCNSGGGGGTTTKSGGCTTGEGAGLLALGAAAFALLRTRRRRDR